jgi:hypothetical protein
MNYNLCRQIVENVILWRVATQMGWTENLPNRQLYAINDKATLLNIASGVQQNPFKYHNLKPILPYIKFRLSDNNNTDAAGYHRDSNYQGKDCKDCLPLHTCVTYLDPSVMEVISGSHTPDNLRVSSLDMVANWFSTDVNRIEVEPGDILFFNAHLIHRGVLTERKNPHRRVLQIFDVFRTQQDYETFAPKILHSRGLEKSEFVDRLCKFGPTMAAMNVYHYALATTGYGGYHNWNNYTTISSDGTCSAIAPDSSNFAQHPLNYYCYAKKVIAPIAAPRLSKQVVYQCYQRWAYRAMFYLVLILVLLAIFFLQLRRKA